MPASVSRDNRRVPYRRMFGALCLAFVLSPRTLSAQAGITTRDANGNLWVPQFSVQPPTHRSLIENGRTDVRFLRPLVQDTVNRKDHTALGALLGAVGGAAIGYEVAVHNRRACGGQQCETGFALQAVIYPVVGGFAGGLIGTVIGGFVARN